MSPIILSAPSGCGKTVIAAHLVARIQQLKRVVTCTTRKQREGEVEGKDYFFLSEEVFQEGIHTQEFLEWAQAHNHYYGTRKNTVNEIVAAGNTPLLVIDVQGAATWKALMPHALTIFILPENMGVLRKWLTKRGKDTAEDMELRLHNAEGEISQAEHFDYQVINRDGHLEETVREIQGIIETEIKN